MISALLRVPEYFHREYLNDIEPEGKDTALISTHQRIALVAIPLLSLYEPFDALISLGMGTVRILSNTQSLYEAADQNSEELNNKVIQLAVSVASVTCLIFAPPLGLLISTVHDLAIELGILAYHINKQDYHSAIESSAKVINTALYLGLFFNAGVPLSVASLSMQVLIASYNLQKELLEGNYLEATGHLAMATVRCFNIQELLSMKTTRDPLY